MRLFGLRSGASAGGAAEALLRARVGLYRLRGYRLMLELLR